MATWLKPAPGLIYRDTATKRVWPETGQAHDPNNLDEVRALNVGDLVECDPPAADPEPEADAVRLDPPVDPAPGRKADKTAGEG